MANNYLVDDMTQTLHNPKIKEKRTKQSLDALKAYYHDVTLEFVKDDTMKILKYTELTQSLSSFLSYLLTNYMKEYENPKQKYVPLREAMKIYSTKYDFRIRDFGKYIILQKDPIDGDIIMWEDKRYDELSNGDGDHDVLILSYSQVLHQTTARTKSLRSKIKTNCGINKQKMIADLKKSLAVPVESDKAMKIMINMGWDGGCLGTRGDGIIEPIKPMLDLKAGAGLGHVKKAEVKKNESKHAVIVNILEDLLVFLKSNESSIELVCSKKLSRKEEGFIANLINMVNIKRRVEVEDEERGLLLHQIYEVVCVKDFYITCLVDGVSRIKFTKTPIVKPLSSKNSIYNRLSATSIVSETLSSPSPIVDNGQGPIRHATESLINLINNRYVSPFSPLSMSRQNLKYFIFRTTTMIFVLDFNQSQLDRIEVKFEKVLNTKERGFVQEIVEMFNKGHNKSGGRTKVENFLLKELLARKRMYTLAAGLGTCNISFTLEKVYDTYKSNPSKAKLTARMHRNEVMNGNIDNMNEIFRSIDEAFPPIIWSQTSDSTLNINDDKSHINNYGNTQKTIQNDRNITEPKKIKSDNLIIVKNVHCQDQNSENVRKIYIDRSIDRPSSYVSENSEYPKSDNQNNFRNAFVNSNSGSSKPVIPTSSFTNANIKEQSEVVGKPDVENIANSYDDNTSIDISDIDICTWSLNDDDSDIDDLTDEEVIDEENNKPSTKIDSSVPSDIGKCEEVKKKDKEKVELKENDIDKVIEESVKRIELKENDNLIGKKRTRTESDDSNLTLFKKYKTVDRVTYVNLTPTEPSEAADKAEFVKKVQTVISLMLDITKELPLLKCHGYRNGALVYSCHNAKSLSWLQTHCVATGDIKITVTEEVLIESIKMSLKINCYIDENYKKIFQRLELYNTGLSTCQWVWLKEEKFNGYIIITFKIDESSFIHIQGKNFRLFVGIDEAQFSVVWT